MAILYVTEFREFGQIGGSGPAPRVPVVANQQVTISGSSVTSAGFNKATHIIRLQADTTCAVQFGNATTLPLATTTGSIRISANQPGEYFMVNPTDVVAVISTT
jgi:hypothetical protein